MRYKGGKEYKSLRELLKWFSLCPALHNELNIIGECINKYPEDVKRYFSKLEGTPLSLPNGDSLEIIKSLYSDIESSLMETDKFNNKFTIERYIEAPFDISIRDKKFRFFELVGLKDDVVDFSYLGVALKQNFEELVNIRVDKSSYDNIGNHFRDDFSYLISFINNDSSEVISGLSSKEKWLRNYNLDIAKVILDLHDKYFNFICKISEFDIEKYNRNIEILRDSVDNISKVNNKEDIESILKGSSDEIPYRFAKAREFSEDYRPSVDSSTIIISEGGVSTLSCDKRPRNILERLYYEVVPDIENDKTVLYLVCKGDVFIVDKKSVDLYREEVEKMLLK